MDNFSFLINPLSPPHRPSEPPLEAFFGARHSAETFIFQLCSPTILITVLISSRKKNTIVQLDLR